MQPAVRAAHEGSTATSRLRGSPDASSSHEPARPAHGLSALALARAHKLRSASLASLCVIACLSALALTAAPALALPAQFGEEGSGAGQFNVPSGVAVEQESGDVYIADRNNQRIDKFDAAGNFLLAWGWGVADGKAEALQTCTSTCFAGIGGAGSGQFEEHSPEGIAVDNDPISPSHGDVYVIDAIDNRVEKFDSSGSFLLMFGGEVNKAGGDVCLAGEECQAGRPGTLAGEFERLNERSIAIDSAGGVYVGDENRIQKFSPVGVAESQFAIPGAGFVENVDVDSANDVYVQARGLVGIHKYEEGGTELGKPVDELGSPSAITLGPSGELFVDDGPNSQHHILKFDPAGNQLLSFDAGPEGGDGGIAYGENLNVIYVLNAGAVRLVTPPPPGPLVLSQSSEAVTPTTATLNALVNPEGAATEYHFEYGTTTAYGESTPISAPLDAVNEVQSVTLAATGGGFTLAFKGEPSVEIPFNATAAEVQAALEGIPGLGAGQVAVTGEPGGPWSVQFTGTRAGQDVPELSAGAAGLTGPEPSAAVATTTQGISFFDDRAASAAIKELQPSTLYHFRVVLSNGTETTDGADQTFTTLPPVLIDGESATQVSSKSARLGAELNPLGEATEYHFEYGLSASYEHTEPIPDASAGSGHTDVSVALELQGLSPSTTYHYRVVAHNALGTVEGEDRTFTTQGEEPSVLPDGRQWEMVSPANKEGVSLEAIAEEGGVIQAAEDGGAMTYIAKAAIEAQSPSSRSIENTQVLSRRSASGWESKDISTPYETVAVILPGFPSEYKQFSGELSVAIVEPQGATPLSAATSERTPYLRTNGSIGQFCRTTSCYSPLVSGCPAPGEACPASVEEAANVPAGTKFGGTETVPQNGGRFDGGVEFVSASPDASRVVLTSPENLTAGFQGAGARSMYEWSGGTLRPLSVLPSGESAGEAGLNAHIGNSNENDTRGAVSAEGDRVVFEAGEHLYLRDMGLEKTVQLDAPQGGIGGGSAGVEFQGASRDGSKVFFSDDARLTGDATAKLKRPDLYECVLSAVGANLSCALHDLTVDANLGEAADVQGAVAAFSEDGRHVYFAANGVLAAGAEPGKCVEESESASCNLYVRDTVTEQTKLVAELSGQDAPDWLEHATELGKLTARTSPDGRYLTFMSQRSLTGYDNRDAKSAQRDEEVFLYDDASGRITCVSCNPSGARPEGVFDPKTFPGLLADRPHTWQEKWLAGSIPGWTLYNIFQARYQSRYLSNSGRMFFNSADALVPQDANRKEDVYQYEPNGVGECIKAGGCVSLISSGSSAEESAFMDASSDGSNVFFLTAAKLSAADVDSDFDLYDAHICTASSPCPPAATSVPPPCATTDSCRQAPSTQPQIFGPPPSATFSGAGNLAPPAPAGKPPVKKPTRAQLLAKALKACAKNPRKKRAACRALAQRRYGSVKKKGAAKKTSTHASSGAKGRGR